MEIKIRTAKSDDIYLIADFQLAMALETENLKLDLNVVRRGVAYVIDNPTTGEYYLMEVNEKVVASTLILFEWSDWRNAKVLWIHSVFVLPEFRNKGVFKYLYRYLQNKVNNNPEFSGLRLYVDKRNTIAQEVYLKLGMNADHYQLFEFMKCP